MTCVKGWFDPEGLKKAQIKEINRLLKTFQHQNTIWIFCTPYNHYMSPLNSSGIL